MLVRTRKTRMRIERHTHPERISVGQDAHVTLSFENVSTDHDADLPRRGAPRLRPRRPAALRRRPDPARAASAPSTTPSAPTCADATTSAPSGSRCRTLSASPTATPCWRGPPTSSCCRPCTRCRRTAAPARASGSEGEQAQLIALHGEDDVTIREYRDGDDLRRIHWPATARTGDLMVRQEDRPAQRRAVVLIDPRPSAHGGSGASSSFEWAVTAAASVAVHLCDSGYAVHLVCAETVETTRAAETMTPDEILDVLAVATLREDTGEDEILRAAQALAAAGGFLVAIVGPSGRDVTSRVASLRQPGTTGLALVLDARSFGTSDAEAAEPHVDALRLAGWRAVAVQRDEDIAHVWALLTAATVGGSR